MNTSTNSSGSRLYGSVATSSAFSMSRAWRKELAHLLARGPKPGLETKAANMAALRNSDLEKAA